jgi:Protein of unknown function (DUF2794)
LARWTGGRKSGKLPEWQFDDGQRRPPERMTRQSTELFRLADYRQRRKTIYFNRFELNQLLAVYSHHVIRGEWRDYAIDHRDGFALFSVFRHSHESPAFSVMKCAGAQNRHGDFLLYKGRQKLSAGKTLSEVLDIFRRKPSLVGGAF